jgi:two-component system, NtrC family, sensor histidine kinase KinB
MSLRAKLLLAQLPLVAALVLLAIVAATASSTLGKASHTILRENYRSVLAAQEMKDAVERLNEASLILAAGSTNEAARSIATERARFEKALAAQESNITEEGESETTGRLRTAWTTYANALDEFVAGPDEGRVERFASDLRPAFREVKARTDDILMLNQDAMTRKSDAAEAAARRLETFVGAATLVGCALAIAASIVLTTRILRPLAALGQTAKRIGEGDLEVRAEVHGKDEIARLAGELNTMVERLGFYRKSSLGELIEAQSAMQAAIDSLPDPVLVVSIDGTLLHLNKAAERVLDIHPEQGAAALTNIAAPVAEAMDRVRRHVLAGHGPYVSGGLEEAVWLERPGGDLHLLPRAMPVYSMEGAVVATTVVLQDVSRLVRSERRHTDLIATVAHEFRTPLTSLRMAVHLCTEGAAGELTEKQKDLLFAAREDCERLQTMVEEFLHVSRIHAGDAPHAPEAVDPEELVKTTIASHERAAAERSVRLVSEALPGLRPIHVDRERLLVALDNLVVNAIRFAPEGTHVIVRARASDGGVRFEVADEGPGVPADYRESIFERTVRVPGSPDSGAGMGLFISRENVRAHGGRIGVESGVGKGSTFWIELPAAHD